MSQSDDKKPQLRASAVFSLRCAPLRLCVDGEIGENLAHQLKSPRSDSHKSVLTPLQCCSAHGEPSSFVSE